MALTIHKLSPLDVARERRPGLYGDGAGLWLHVGPTGGKSWLFRYTRNGHAREMGLGPVHTIGLSDARQRAQACRQQLLDGADPLDARDAARGAAKLAAAAAITFKACAVRYIHAHQTAWRNEKHAAQWTATLETYAFPVIGDLPVAGVTTGHVTQIIEPIWADKGETASRVRGRIEAILDYAATHGWRTGENPARWRGHLENVLPRRSNVRAVTHHAALPWREIGEFMTRLREQPGTGARALEFAILTAARTGEVIGATWAEMDLAAALWTVPAKRMKGGRQHRVPLSKPVIAILRELAHLGSQPGDFVFPGARRGKPMSNMTLLAVLKRMDRADLTTHGFRSTFRDWAAEETRYPGDVAEAALAHAVADKVEAAYRRGDLFEKRRRLMADWSAYCDRPAVTAGTALPLRRGA